jgi:hypothetical protein
LLGRNRSIDDAAMAPRIQVGIHVVAPRYDPARRSWLVLFSVTQLVPVIQLIPGADD